MKSKQILPDSDFDALPLFPDWGRINGNETLEDTAFLSGAALAILSQLLSFHIVPHALLRARLALKAAEACVGLSGRSERAGDLRDAVHLLRPGDDAGPAGNVYLAWQQAAARPLSVAALHRALPAHSPEQIAVWLEGTTGGPVARSSAVLERVLNTLPYGEEVALILADAALAQAMGWKYLVPLFANAMTLRRLGQTGEGLRRACHQALVASADEAIQTGRDLSRRAARLQEVTPKLRAKAAPEAVALFLTRDALSPSLALTGIMSDRAARRLCDRLVVLGAVRELTGRDSFRLYGV